MFEGIQDASEEETRIWHRFPLPFLPELEQAAATKQPVIFREGTTELPVVIDEVTVSDKDRPEQKIEFTGSVNSERVRGFGSEQLGALFIEFENTS